MFLPVAYVTIGVLVIDIYPQDLVVILFAWMSMFGAIGGCLGPLLLMLRIHPDMHGSKNESAVII